MRRRPFAQLLIVTSCIAGLIIVPLTGCLAVAAGAAAGVGTFAYVTGELKGDLEATLERSARATKRGLADLKFRDIEVTSDALVGAGHAMMADDTSVSIDLKKVSDTTTQIRIRVGVFGDEKKSLEILDAIKKRL